MKNSWQGLTGWCAAVLVLALAACAPARTPPAVVDADAAPKLRQNVFSVGFASISKKHLGDIALGSMALEGMKGLGAVDPALTVSQVGNTVTLAAAGKTVGSFPAPGGDDAEGWAALVLKLSRAGNAVSLELREASAEKIYEAVYDGALSNLDIYSRYAGAEDARRNRAKRQGFGGIGIRFRAEKGTVSVSAVMPQTPAARAGLRRGDHITHIDGHSTTGMSVRQAADKLRGARNSRVRLTVARGGAAKPLSFAIKRAHIVAQTVFASQEDGFVTLRVSGFNKNTALGVAEHLREARRELGDGMRGVVLDLRGNPGGLLKQSIKVVDLFLSDGQIISTRGRHPDSHQHYEAGGNDLAPGLPVAVLVDGKSASAAEIIAAALQDRGRAVVIGTTSFGKGTVQTVIRLPNDGEITLTWSRLLAPSGYAFHGLGVRPSICTSGIAVDGRGVIAKALVDSVKTAATLAAWRRIELDEMAGRKLLRASCPAERRKASLELDVARRLLNDRTLYGRTLGLMEDTAEANH
jgi:carboxyl-terminal processing protease